MKRLHKGFALLLCVMLFAVPLRAFAQEPDDPYDETEPETEQIEITDVPDTTAPHGTLTQPTTTKPASTTAPKSVEPPLVKITRDNLPAKPKAGETFTLTVVFHNYSGDVSLRAGLASFETSDGLVLMENAASKVVPVIGPSGVRSVQIRLRVSENAAAADQSVSVAYAYSYRTPDGLQQAEASEKLLLTVATASESERSASASATPNIIVTGYDYGGTITAGDAFTLRLSFRNTSKKLPVENIVMSVEVGDGLSITTASNTYFYALLGAGKTQSQTIPMRVAVNANPEGARIEISFRYEYVDNGTRSDASASERLSVPINIPDRFTVSEPDMELVGTQNEELSLSLPYINKSRIEVSNVSAELLYDDTMVYCEQPHVNLGNFDSGKSGTIDFYFVPLESGSGEVTVQITYEDDMMQEKQLQIRVPYYAEEGYFDPGSDEPMDLPEEEQTGSSWVHIVICAAALAFLVLIVVLIVRRRKKKKAAEASIDFDWGPPQEVKANEDH